MSPSCDCALNASLHIHGSSVKPRHKRVTLNCDKTAQTTSLNLRWFDTVATKWFWVGCGTVTRLLCDISETVVTRRVTHLPCCVMVWSSFALPYEQFALAYACTIARVCSQTVTRVPYGGTLSRLALTEFSGALSCSWDGCRWLVLIPHGSLSLQLLTTTDGYLFLHYRLKLLSVLLGNHAVLLWTKMWLLKTSAWEPRCTADRISNWRSAWLQFHKSSNMYFKWIAAALRSYCATLVSFLRPCIALNWV